MAVEILPKRVDLGLSYLLHLRLALGHNECQKHPSPANSGEMCAEIGPKEDFASLFSASP